MKARAPPPKYRGKHLVSYQVWNIAEAFITGQPIEVDLFSLPPYVAQGITGLRKTGVQLQSGIDNLISDTVLTYNLQGNPFTALQRRK